jgi:hypothetical protein
MGGRRACRALVPIGTGVTPVPNGPFGISAGTGPAGPAVVSLGLPLTMGIFDYVAMLRN